MFLLNINITIVCSYECTIDLWHDIVMLKIRAIEQIVRSFANHRRIEMLDLIEREPELSVDEISEKLKMDYKLGSFYTKRLLIAGLIMKKSKGKSICHKVTDRGLFVLTFVRTLE